MRQLALPGRIPLLCSALFLLIPFSLDANTPAGDKQPLSSSAVRSPGSYTVRETVVSTAKTEQDVFFAPQYASFLTREEIEDRIPASTPELFDRMSGILVQKTNWGGGSVFIRGLTGKHILLLVDGVRLNNSLYRSGPHQYLNTLDPNMIERIEVIRGPMSVLYGSDALGGAVNIITKKRTDFEQERGWNGQVSGKYGSAARERVGRVQLEANANRFGAIMGATYRCFSDLRGGRGTGVQTPTGYEEVNADAKVNLLARENHEAVFATQFTRQFDVPKTSEVTLGGKRKFNYEPQVRSLQYMQYEGRDLLDGWLSLARVNVSYNLQIEGEEVIKDDPDVETRERNGARTLGALIHLRSRPVSLFRFSGGAEFYQDWIRSSKEQINHATGMVAPMKSAFPDDAVYRHVGVYLQDETPVGDRILLTLGGRYSHVYTSGVLRDPAAGTQAPLLLETDNLSGNAQVRVEIVPWLCLVGGVAQGFRAPNMEDFFGKVDFTTEIPNTNLKPERSLNYECGLKVRSARFQGNLFWFRSEYEDLIDRVDVPMGANTTVQRQNVGEARIQGVELDFRVRLPRGFSVMGTYAWIRGTNLTRDEPLRRIPPMTGSLTVRYEPGDRYWVEAWGRFAGRQDRLSGGDMDDKRIPDGGTPGYAVFGLSGGIRVCEGLETTLAVENIGDRKYKTHGSGIFAPGNNVMLGARYTF